MPESWEERFKFEQAFIPKPVVETRSKTEFVAEVMFQDANYIVSGVVMSREFAEQLANDAVVEIMAAMILAGLNELKGCKKAKV